MWNDELKLKCMWKTESMMCCSVEKGSGKKNWKLMGCYGTLYRREKESFWNNLESVVSSRGELWVLLGDFNEILNTREKFGGRTQSIKHYFLGKFMQNVGAFNLGYMGKRFT